VKSLWIAVAAFALMLVNPVSADEPTPKQAAIRKLIELTGAAQMGQQMADTLMTQLAPAFPSVPAELWKEFAQMLDPDEMTDLILPLYDKHFTLEEIQALAAFYESPAGKKFIATMPALMQDSMAVGNEWGQRKAAELIGRLKERGYEPAKI
jgi:uncharacterized protein